MLSAFLSCAVCFAVPEKPLKPTAVLLGSHSQIKKARFDLIEDAMAWKKLWAEHRGMDRTFTETDQTLEIDYESQYMVCLFLGQTLRGLKYGGVHRFGDQLHIRLIFGGHGEQFRPEPFDLKNPPKPPEPPEDLRSDFQKSKDADVYRYIFVVLPKPGSKIVIEEERYTYGDRWKVLSRLQPVEEK